MLKITVHDSATEIRLQLEGKLAGPWVEELGQCWQTATAAASGRKTVVDLREVDFVDDGGQKLLREMCHAGVKLVAATPLIRDIVARCATVEGKPFPRANVNAPPDQHGPDPHSL